MRYNFSIVTFLVLLFSIVTERVIATNYYISATGNDLADGLTPSAPWRTIDKVNTAFGSYPAGSTVYFNRGDTFYGTLIIGKSGTSGNPITIGAYGIGSKPIITGFTTIMGWTDEGGGIFSKVITSEAQTNMVTIDGKQVGMGRFPDTSFLTFETATANSITDNGLGTSTNWSGAQIVIRKNNWTLDRCNVTNHTGDVLSYTNLGTTQTPSAGFGYFLTNDLRTLTTYGEWYQNKGTGKFYMYFGAVDPTTKMVQVATLNNLIYNTSSDYITVDNLNLKGSISIGVNFNGTDDYNNVQNCNISFIGSSGIDIGYGTGCIIDNNFISDCNSYGIYNISSASITTNNTISNIGLIAGQSLGWTAYSGIHMNGNGGVVSKNIIKKCGYNGIIIRYKGAGSTVSFNRIDSVCLVLNDGGGIYTSTVNETPSSRILDHNIITNVIGNVNGSPGTISMAEGIYLDEYSSNVIVTYNTVANCGNSGIKLHKAHNDIVTDNAIFNCKTGIDIQNSSVITDYISGISLRRNIFFAKTTSQNVMYFHTTNNDDMTLFGIADSNYYARPIDDNLTFKLSQPALGTIQKSLVSWQAFSHQDANSKKSPVPITDLNDIRFEYNATIAPTTISLSGKYITSDSKIYDGSITLQPYCSVILIKFSTPTAINALPDSNKPIVNVYPNPVSIELRIEIEEYNGKAGFEIVNLSGRSVLKGLLFEKTAVNVTDFSPGIYFLKIEQGRSFEVKKIIKI
jgi:parallel beta-helix repeat protein